MLETLFSGPQIVGYLALGFGVAGFSQQDDHKLKILLCVQVSLLSVHFYLLGAHTAAAMSGLTLCRNLISFLKLKHRIAPFFFALYIILGAWTYQSPVDIFAILAFLAGTYAWFYLDGIRMRGMLLFCTGNWIVHNVVVASIGPLIMEVIQFARNARTINLLKKRKSDEKTDRQKRPWLWKDS